MFAGATGQEISETKLGVVNGRASYLPIPEYPKEAKEACASGKVEVEVSVGLTGRVISAKAVSGDELLHKPSVAAAKKARFGPVIDAPPITYRGVLVYNFDHLSKCLLLGIVNKKAVSIPKPKVDNIIHPRHLQVSEVRTVEIAVVIDVLTGRVVSARAISGHPLLLAACERSAAGAVFYPSFINSKPIRAKGILIYKFKPDGKIEY